MNINVIMDIVEPAVAVASIIPIIVFMNHPITVPKKVTVEEAYKEGNELED